jgi:hypothetical protein
MEPDTMTETLSAGEICNRIVVDDGHPQRRAPGSESDAPDDRPSMIAEPLRAVVQAIDCEQRRERRVRR